MADKVPNGIAQFIKWIFFTPMKTVSSLPIMKTATAGLLQSTDLFKVGLIDPIKNLFGIK